MKLVEALKFPALLLITSASRLIPLPVPNVEPIMAASMPAAKKWGALGAAGIAVVAYALKDVLQARAGLWTLYGALAYALVALLAFELTVGPGQQWASAIKLNIYILSFARLVRKIEILPRC